MHCARCAQLAQTEAGRWENARGKPQTRAPASLVRCMCPNAVPGGKSLATASHVTRQLIPLPSCRAQALSLGQRLIIIHVVHVVKARCRERAWTHTRETQGHWLSSLEQKAARERELISSHQAVPHTAHSATPAKRTAARNVRSSTRSRWDHAAAAIFVTRPSTTDSPTPRRVCLVCTTPCAKCLCHGTNRLHKMPLPLHKPAAQTVSDGAP